MKKTIFKGNDAVAEASILAGCKLFFGYPITPSTEIPEYLSLRLVEEDGVFLQAESEVAAINMVYGAAATGKRVMTASSGPGYSLKQEGLSYLAAAELPCVVVDVMRSGPGLGGLGPTQADYFQITKGGGHGDYYPIALAPASVQEIIDLTGKAFDLAEKYRTPVIIAIDGVLGQMMEPVEFPTTRYNEPSEPPDWAVGNINKEKKNIKCYWLTPELGEEVCLKLQKKHELIKENEQLYEETFLEDAECVFVAFGLCARIVETTVEILRKENIKAGLIKPVTIWPFPEKAFSKLPDSVQNFMVVELSQGQMIEDVRLAVRDKYPVGFYSRQGGMLPSPKEIAEAFKKQFHLE